MQFLDETEKKMAESLAAGDEHSKKIYSEHMEIEKMLNKYSTKPFLTPDEQKTIKELKLKKLNGNDIMKKIIKEKIAG
jgi:sulfur relay (sulfurtransferase) DsrC/TusE family protein